MFLLGVVAVTAGVVVGVRGQVEAGQVAVGSPFLKHCMRNVMTSLMKTLLDVSLSS